MKNAGIIHGLLCIIANNTDNPDYNYTNTHISSAVQNYIILPKHFSDNFI